MQSMNYYRSVNYFIFNMHQNMFAQPNQLRSSETTAQTKPELNLDGLNRPFIVSRPRSAVYPQRQVSATAHWNNEEKESYAIFACYFRQVMNDQNFTKFGWNIFKGMAKFIQTRNPQQCRSHHLKLTREFQNLPNFIAEAVRRIRNLKQKISLAEDRLNEIQNEFQLFLVSIEMEKSSRREFCEPNYLRNSSIDSINYDSIQKNQKQDFIKTADNYPQQQNPVNFNNNNLNIFSSRSEFKPFGNAKRNFNRESIPSFQDNYEENSFVKQEYKPTELVNKITNFNSQISEEQIKNSFQSIKSVPQKPNGVQNQNKIMQKMKQFMECHYLFQLWTSKLQKIIRHASIQDNLQQDPQN